MACFSLSVWIQIHIRDLCTYSNGGYSYASVSSWQHLHKAHMHTHVRTHTHKEHSHTYHQMPLARTIRHTRICTVKQVLWTSAQHLQASSQKIGILSGLWKEKIQNVYRADCSKQKEPGKRMTPLHTFFYLKGGILKSLASSRGMDRGEMTESLYSILSETSQWREQSKREILILGLPPSFSQPSFMNTENVTITDNDKIVYGWAL